MEAITTILGLFWSVAQLLAFGAWYSIPAFFVERYRLKQGKNPCRKLWPMTLAGLLSILGAFILTVWKPEAADLAFAWFLGSCTFTSVMLWLAVGASVAKKHYHPEA